MDSIIKPRFTLAHRASAHPQENEAYPRYARQGQFAPRGTFIFKETVEDYSTARVPVYKQDKPLHLKIGIYGLCFVFWAGILAASLFFLHLGPYHVTSIMVYIDFLWIVAILASTCFAQVTRSLHQEQRRSRIFAFRQSPSSSSLLGKSIEYSVYLLSYGVSLYILFASTLLFGNTAIFVFLSFTLATLYMGLLKPGMVKCILWMIIAPWHKTTHMKSEQIATLSRYHPLVSVVVPAWNEEVGILPTMESILVSAYTPLELIVINDGSTDTSDEKIHQFITDHGTDFIGKTIVYHYQDNTGKSGALNTGIGLAHGEIIITTDADCMMAPDCITYLAQMFSDPKVMGCSGNCRVGNVHSLLGRIQAIEYAMSFYARKTDSLLGTVFVMSGAISAFRSVVFDRIGRFHTGNITEDLDITMRMHKAGLKIVSEPRAIIYTESPVTLVGLYRQRLRWTRGALDAFGEHSDILFSRKQEQGKLHAWVVLPLIRLNQCAVVFQALCKYAILVLCIVTHQYIALTFTMWLVSTIVAISILSSPDYRETALLSPIAWILLEIPNTIHVFVLLAGWWNYLTKKKQSWQRWSRQGISGV